MAVARAHFAVAFALLFSSFAVFAQDADLGVTKNGPATAAPGTDVTYSIFILNNGPDDAANAQMSDPIPPGMTFVSINQPGGFICADPGVGNNGTVTCTALLMTAGSSVTFNLVVHIPLATPAGTIFTNMASVKSDTLDPFDENNSSTAGTSTPNNDADVFITKNGPSFAAAGSDVTYTFSVGNTGPATATTVDFSDTLPGTMTYVSSTTPAGFNCTIPVVGSGGTIHCTAASLVAGSNSPFTIVGHIPPATPS